MLDLTAVFADFPELSTERTVLRAVVLDDAEAIYHIMSDPQVVRYLGRPPLTTLNEAVQQVQAYRRAFNTRQSLRWIVVHREQNAVMGTVVYWNLNLPHFRAEIGYVLGREWWGQGIMTEVAGALLTFGFTRMGLHSVEAQLDPDNTASKRLLEKLGFVQEGYFRENYYDPVKQQFTDTAVYSLLKQTWDASP